MNDLRSRVITTANRVLTRTRFLFYKPSAVLQAVDCPPKKPPVPDCIPDPTPPCPPKPSDIPESADGTTGAGAEPPARPMKYPYTYTARIVQFPWKFYFDNAWVFRYFTIAVICCLPVFKFIHDGMNSPGNVEKWNAMKAKEKEEAEEHGH